MATTELDRQSELDARAIDDLTATFFAAFTSGDGIEVRLDALRGLFLPQAVIIKTCGGEPTVYDVDAFIAPRRQILTDGTLTDFREWEVDGETRMFGDVAQRWSRYAKSGVQSGARFTGSGSKTLQFVRTGSGWRISAAAWDDERPAS